MSTSHLIQSSTLPIAQPVYVLRGHYTPIHTLLFLRQNTRLLSGDADGWVVLWSIAIKRPVAVWKAHEVTILGAATWGDDRIITHGRDGKVCVWSLPADDEMGFSTELPLEGEQKKERRQPWLLHALDAPTTNFCAFSSCAGPRSANTQEASVASDSSATTETTNSTSEEEEESTLLIATASATESEIQIHSLPSELKVGIIPGPDQTRGKTGMVMALCIFTTSTNKVAVVAGYESGRTYVYVQIAAVGCWEARYTCCPHSQPILSMDVDLSLGVYFTSGADAVVAKHPLSLKVQGGGAVKEVQTKHAGQQGLSVRSDGKVFATAGWDARVRVYSAKTLKELAVLKWHKDGCFATAFADVDVRLGGAEAAEVGDRNQGHMVPRETRIIRQTAVEQSRNAKAQLTHWLAAGSKDGKVSLWDIY